MLIRLLIFSTLVLTVNLVAGIFAKDLSDQDFGLKSQHNFSTKDERPKTWTLLRESARYTDSFGMQRDSTNLLKKPKITKRFAKEDAKAEGEKNNLTRLAYRRRSLLRDERRRTESQKSVAGARRRYQRLQPIDKNEEILEADESTDGLAPRSPATVSVIGLTSSSNNGDLGDESKVVTKNNKTFERREFKENETDAKNDTGTDRNFRNWRTEPSEPTLKTNATTTVIPKSQPISTYLRKRRPSTVTRTETPASPLPVAAALTMSESLYNHFRPLDKDVPEDHLLPFLDFGKKLVPVSAKTTSPLTSSSSTSSTNSIETMSTSPRAPPLGQYNLLNATPQKVLLANSRTTHIPREEEVHEDMDVSVVKSVVEKNKASRSKGTALQFLRNLGGLYRKQETSSRHVVANSSIVGNTSLSPAENSGMKTEQVTRNNSDFEQSSRNKMRSPHRVSIPSNSTEYPSASKVTQSNSDSASLSTTEGSDVSPSEHSTLSSHTVGAKTHRKHNQTSQSSEISEHLAVSPTRQSSVPKQLTASSSRVEATVSTLHTRGRPSATTRNITSFSVTNRRPPSTYLNVYRHSSTMSRSSKPSDNNTSKSENISLYDEIKTRSEKEVNLANSSVTTNSNEKTSLVPTSSTSLQMQSVSPSIRTVNNGFVKGTNVEAENKVNVSELVNGGEKLVVNSKERNSSRQMKTKTDGNLFEDTVNNAGSNISSQSSLERVTSKVTLNTSPESSQTSVTMPTEVTTTTSSVQSPTTKILSTAVVTSVSVKGAWPVMVTDSPALEPTLIPTQGYISHNTKKEHLEHVLEPPALYDINQTQPIVKQPVPYHTHGSLSRQFTRNMTTTYTTSGGNSSRTYPARKGSVVSKNPDFGALIKDINSNSSNVTRIDTDYGRNNTVASLVNGTKVSETYASSTSTTERTRTAVKNTDPTLMYDHANGVTSSLVSMKNSTVPPQVASNPTDTPTVLSETTVAKGVTLTVPEHGTMKEHVQDDHSTLSPITTKLPAPESEFDFPLLKLYNTSTVWSLPLGGVTKSSNESRKTATEYPSTGNGNEKVTNHPDTMVNITEGSTHEISVVDGITKDTETVNSTTDMYIDESRKDDSDKDGKEETRYNSVAGVRNYSTAVSNGGVNLSLDSGNVLSKNRTNATVGNPRPGESVATTQGAIIAVYVLSALGIVPLTVGVALTAKYCVQRRRKLLDDTDACSDISSRRGTRSGGGQTGSEVGSPISGTKLPRVQTHLSWDQEKATVPILATRWEFPRSKLRLQTVLGQGNFGQVLKAEADDISGHEGTTRLVAVKTVKEGASSREKEDLLRELEIMQQLGSHANVVTLLGCCTEKEPYLLIMEYVMYGKLLAFLRDHRTRQHYYNFSEDSDALTSRDLTIFAYCVARGMEYLGSKGIIHRDLAARNVLVDHNKMCKIADFGMSRSVRETGDMYEQRHTKGALPIRWMAPESLHYRIFTHKSDVWSFGILMWEIVTLGSMPYPTMGAREVMRRVRDGYRLERPNHCRTELFRVISRCWNADPNKRPDFAVLRHEIGALIEASKDGGGYVDLESFAESNKYSYSRSEDQSSHHHHHHHPGSAAPALGSRNADEETVNM